ncbi:MAG: sigma-70 family RNA polymerase sigma factor [Armatimonadetes bacterium]|nr:sigma-70 family RNA polymerase sigma factor [Armatimonadota bacterium]MDW8028030.1 sigma-70 family RNA polymerase sigma factor [Armatimonadota bacterium]
MDEITVEFEKLVKLNREALYRIAVRLAGNRDDAEDLLMEALTEAWESFSHFRSGTDFVRWVATIMTHTFLDWRRKNDHYEFVSLNEPKESDENDEPMDLPEDADDPEAIAVKREFWKATNKALDELPPDFKAVVVLVDMEGLSYEEAAKALNCPIGTIRSRLHRARIFLREKLKDWL